MNLNIPQLIAIAQAAGFSGDDLATAVSVALAESSGNPQAYNPETAAGAPQGKGSFGLWQIYLNAHPEFAGTNLFDPQTNAAAAFSVYSGAGGSFAPWSTYKNGAYQSNLAAVNAALAPASDGDVEADAADGSSYTPSGSDLAGMAVAGLLAYWLASRFL